MQKEDVQQQQQMFRLIEDWQRSHISQLEYCKSHDVAYHVFHYWYKKYKTVHLRQPPGQGFTALQLTPTGPALVEVHLATGHRIAFYTAVDSTYLKALVS